MLCSPIPLNRAAPLRALAALRRRPYPFLLQSSLPDTRARWSFVGADPFAVFSGGDYERVLRAWRELAGHAAAEFAPVPRVFARGGRARAGAGAEGAGPEAVPFMGGAVGYWAYDFGRRLERLPEHAADDLRLPDFSLAFYDVVLAIDHEHDRAWLFSSGLPLVGASRVERAKERLREVAALISSGGAASAPEPERRGVTLARSTFTPDGYRRSVRAVQEHIRRGDLFQANLSQRWTLDLEPRLPGERAARLFESLATHSPAPYSAYLDLGDHAIASASPERFLELRGRRVETRPIYGTRPRGADAVEDARLAAELLASGKDRAENVMIVDVLRNDLGRVCETGSVQTPALCELESFPQVHHLTSTVTGTLRAGLDAFDLLAACFPGGSITGAPKIRAMEILDALEPVRRHIYTGAIGYLDWRGDADLNIAIRTALVSPSAVHFGAGGGITSDSDADAEYEETLHKAEGMRRALSSIAGPVALGPESAFPDPVAAQHRGAEPRRG